MLNLKKIIKLVLIAAFVCVMQARDVWAVRVSCPGGGAIDCPSGKKCFRLSNAAANDPDPFFCGNSQSDETSIRRDCVRKCGSDEVCNPGTRQCIKKDSQAAKHISTGSNTQQSDAAVTGCSADFGLFSGLITAGSEIFNGLRDLIYVVAGFGIIGVAVGGFFGNMNWKWLGAIIIALVVIATTGELISAITGCEQYTSKMIQDTLK